MPATTDDAPLAGRQQSRKAVLGSWVGTVIEYYDFAIYGLAASAIFSKLFFPESSALIGTLLSLSTFAVGFVARPVGAAVFGHFGDRIGRKKVLVVTLGMMGTATFLIGALPTYQHMGAVAPALLVLARLAQGFSAGGEYGGAILMAVEHSGKAKRSFRGSLINTGTSAGLVLANLVFLGVFQLSEDAMLSWGWRIPFLFSGVLVLVGLWVRVHLEESPEFTEVKKDRAVRRMPVVDVFRQAGGRVALAAVGILSSGIAFTMASVYSLGYAESGLGMTSGEMLEVLLPATLVILVFIPLAGKVADRVGNRAVFLAGAGALVVLPFAWLALLETRSYWLMLLGFVLLFLGYSANYAVVPAFYSQIFPPELRFTGISVGFTVGLIAGNAVAPAISTYLLEATGGWVGIAVYMGAMALLSFVAGLFLRELPDPQAEPEGPGEPAGSAQDDAAESTAPMPAGDR